MKLRLDSDGISLTTIKNPEYEYLTSDRPVNILDPDNGFVVPMSPSNFFTLPIDSKHALSLLPDCPKEIRYKIQRNQVDGYMDTLTQNIQQHTKADRFLLGSEKGLKTQLKIIERIDKRNKQV